MAQSSSIYDNLIIWPSSVAHAHTPNWSYNNYVSLTVSGLDNKIIKCDRIKSSMEFYLS